MEIIDITSKLSEFEKHLNLNRQTIVSAKFGDGKTYFLNKYIEQHIATEKLAPRYYCFTPFLPKM